MAVIAALPCIILQDALALYSSGALPLASED